MRNRIYRTNRIWITGTTATLLVLSCAGEVKQDNDPGDSENDTDADAGDGTDTDTDPDTEPTETDSSDSDTASDTWVEAPGMQTELAGVNLAGAEFGSEVPGVHDVDYTYPKAESLDYFIDKGMNVFRIPFLWERLQRTLYGDFDENEQSRLVALVTAVSDRGARAILDPHNYARYGGQVIGAEIGNDAFSDFWSRLALLFADNDRVIFGLMNEPHDMDTAQWFSAATAATAAIRDVGAENLILLPGNRWTGAHSWRSFGGELSNADGIVDYSDPLDNVAVEVHQYLDSNSSGSGGACVSDTIGVERVTEFTEWARENGYRAFLGEFGAPANRVCLHSVDNMLSFVGENADVWLGWTWWAAGPWWGDYPLSVEPETEGEDKPQMTVLSRHLDAP